jgi:hypothetical protein
MKNLLLLAPLSLLALAGCGADVEGACTNYVDAYTACATTYAEAVGVDPSTVALPESTCDGYAGAKDQASADLLNCYADVYAAADCSTADGWTAATAEFATCQ